MAKYRKKPVVIDAWQWTGKVNDLPEDITAKAMFRIEGDCLRRYIGLESMCGSIDCGHKRPVANPAKVYVTRHILFNSGDMHRLTLWMI